MKENIWENNIFYICSLIEYIARKTNNTKKYIVNKLGKDYITKIYSLADVYHSENIDKITEEIIKKCNIAMGNYNIININAQVPSYYDMGKVYKRLIIRINNDKDKIIDTLIEVMTSWIIEKLDNYESNLYYENPDYIYYCYLEGKII